jgi:5,5'-dehydrodivanillate O-demethylase oxygenase subunit
MKRRYGDFASVGPGTAAGKLLRSFWQPIHLAKDLPKRKPLPIHILGEDFTLYRGESGAPHLLGPTCAHRGVKLSTGRVEGEALRCFYHGWKFDGDGRCVEQPAERQPFCERVRVPGYPVREYLGMIFAYLGGGEAPQFFHLDAYDAEGHIYTYESNRPWPFFHQLENSVDEVHFNFTHRRSKFTDVGLNDEIPDLDCNETGYGIERLGRRSNAVRRSHILMPNCMYSMVFDHDRGWCEHIAWRVPRDDNSHSSFIADLIHKTGADLKSYLEHKARQRDELKKLEPALDVVARVLRGELHADDVPERPDLVLIQDAVAMMSQGPRDRERDVLGASDKQVNMLRRLWTRELRAVERGKPIKRWTVPEDLVPTRGTQEEAMAG